jgi:hypothetical protein
MTDDYTYIKDYSVEKIGKVETSQLDKVVVIKNNQFIQRSNPPA